jgi:predicted nucleic acid-binding protein
MFLDADPNIIFSSILNRGNSAMVFEYNELAEKYDFIFPQFSYVELGKHLSEIARRSIYPISEATEALEFIMDQITLIAEEEYKDKLEEARIILGEHEKDVPYLALALAFNCKIFLGDKALKQIIPDKVLTPRELLEEFGS